MGIVDYVGNFRVHDFVLLGIQANQKFAQLVFGDNLRSSVGSPEFLVLFI